MDAAPLVKATPSPSRTEKKLKEMSWWMEIYRMFQVKRWNKSVENYKPMSSKYYLGKEMAEKATKSDLICIPKERVWTNYRTLTSLDLGMFGFQEQITWRLHVGHKQESFICSAVSSAWCKYRFTPGEETEEQGCNRKPLLQVGVSWEEVHVYNSNVCWFAVAHVFSV